ncbi:MAG: hypothetical protein CMJ18_27505 [Phycisphaeraceae bacterium]|nr:hypothetical protein [Phycisphaeraceae bacterium]
MDGECFQPTRWSLVQQAADDDDEISLRAWRELCRLYRPAIEAMAHRLARRYRLDASWADDAGQEILLKLPRIARGAHAKRVQASEQDSERPGGADGFRFRAYVATTIHNALKDALRARGRQVPLVAEHGGGDPDDPVELVEHVAWARCAIRQALDAMKGECERTGRADIWGIFAARIVDPILNGRPQVPYDELVAAHGLASTIRAHSLLQTAKRTYVRHLKETIGMTLSDPRTIDDEIRDLAATLASSSARSAPADRRPIETTTVPDGVMPCP